MAWKTAAGTDDICRLHACAAESGETVLNLVPSRILDTNLSKDDFLTCLGGRLGVDMCIGGGACRFCSLAMDVKGRHPQSCMAGGDAVALHNGLRDLLHGYCARARLRPQAEAPGRARVIGTTLCGDPMMQSRPTHNGSVITLAPPAPANKLASITSPWSGNIQGGSTAETRAFLHRLAGMVATVEGVDLFVVKARLSDQLAVVLARGAGRALRRRCRAAGATAHASGLVAGLVLDP